MYIHYLYTFRPSESGFNAFTDGRTSTGSQAPSQDCNGAHRGKRLWNRRAYVCAGTPPALSSILPSNQMIKENEKESIVSSFAFEKMCLRNLLAVGMDFYFFFKSWNVQSILQSQYDAFEKGNCKIKNKRHHWHKPVSEAYFGQLVRLLKPEPSMLTHPSSRPGAPSLRGGRCASWS